MKNGMVWIALLSGVFGFSIGTQLHDFALTDKSKVTVVSVYDGDTFRCDVEGWPPIIGENMGIRINGIDTPEMNDSRPRVKVLAKKARDYARQRLENGDVELKNIKRGKYFRIVADVYVDGSNLGNELLRQKLAKKYDGGKKPKW